MTAIATTEAKLADNWADRAIAALAAVTDVAGWIVANRMHLHKCDQLNPEAFARIKDAIAARRESLLESGLRHLLG